MKRLVSRVIARRIVAEIELQGGRKPPVGGHEASCGGAKLADDCPRCSRLFCGAPAAALDETEK